jgi:2'-5' RNA ligase
VADVVPTRPADRHLTLVFLGRVPQATVMDLWRSLPPLTLPATIRALAWERFGRRAIALSLADDDGRLGAAADVCAEAAGAHLRDLRVPAKFRPHVTLGRVAKRASPPAPAALRTWPVPPAPLAVGAPTLFRSRDDPAGDRYEVMAQQDGGKPS